MIGHAIATAPVVGPVISFGIDLFTQVREEIAEARRVSPEELAQMIQLFEPVSQ